jgi:hypothetical protein
MNSFLKDSPNIFNAIVLGLVIVIVGLLSSVLVKPLFGVSLPEVCKKWNQNHVMEFSLFFTGFISYYVLKYLKQV